VGMDMQPSLLFLVGGKAHRTGNSARG
jgi:hypothetical protein